MSEKEDKAQAELLSIGTLLKNAWQNFRGRKWTLLAMMLASVCLPILTVAPFVVLGFVAAPFVPGFETWTMAGCIVVGAIMMLWFGNWSWSAFFETIADEQCGVKEAFTRARPKVMAHIWLGVLTGLLVTGAHLLLIIPGIIFTVWFFFAPFVFIEEGERGLNALLKSKAYVKGRWFAVAIRLVAIWLLFVAIACIPVVGQLLVVFLVPLSFVYTHLLYKDLKANKRKTPFVPKRKDKATVVSAGALGFALPVVLVVVFMGSMSQMPFSVLKASLGSSKDVSADLNVRPHNPMKSRKTFSIQTDRVQPTNMVEKDIATLKDRSQDWTKRSQAAFRLGMTGEAKVVPSLVAAFKTDEQWAVRQNAIQAVQKLKATSCVPDLIQVLELDENVFVRKAAAVALGEFGDIRAKVALEKALNDQGVVTRFENEREIEVKAVVKAAQAALDKLGIAETQGPAPALATAKVTPSPQEQDPKKLAIAPAKSTPRTLSGEETKQYRDIIDACDKAVKIQPNDSLAYHNRAVAHFKLGDLTSAIKDFDLAIKYNAKDAKAYYNRAIVHSILGNYTAAIADGIKAIEMDPANKQAYVNRGIDYMALGKMKEAVADFTKVISMDANDGATYYARALAYQKMGSLDQADKDFAKAAKLGDNKAKQYLKTVQGGTPNKQG